MPRTSRLEFVYFVAAAVPRRTKPPGGTSWHCSFSLSGCRGEHGERDFGSFTLGTKLPFRFIIYFFMRLHPEKFEKERVDCEGNDYALCIVQVADRVMSYLEEIGEGTFDASDLITKADRELEEGITGNMAAYVSMLVTKYHSRGEDFRKSWNKSWGRDDAQGVINPAMVTFNSPLSTDKRK